LLAAQIEDEDEDEEDEERHDADIVDDQVGFLPIITKATILTFFLYWKATSNLQIPLAEASNQSHRSHPEPIIVHHFI
jgi:hypothetical protein